MSKTWEERNIRSSRSSQHLQEGVQMLRPVIILRRTAMHVLQPTCLGALARGLHTEHIDRRTVGKDLDNEWNCAVAQDDPEVLGLDPIRPPRQLIIFMREA